MDKIKTVKIKNPDGSISEETYTISVDSINVDMENGRDLQDTIGDINIDEDGNIAEQLKKYKKYDSLYSDVDDLKEEVITLNTDIKKKTYFFNTVAEMKADTRLKNGDMVTTLGYYEPNDGGGAEYRIVSTTDEYVETLNNNLKAELIIKNSEINVLQMGAKGDASFDNTNILKSIFYLKKNNIKILIPNGIYNTYSWDITGNNTAVTNIEMIGVNKPTLNILPTYTNRTLQGTYQSNFTVQLGYYKIITENHFSLDTLKLADGSYRYYLKCDDKTLLPSDMAKEQCLIGDNSFVKYIIARIDKNNPDGEGTARIYLWDGHSGDKKSITYNTSNNILTENLWISGYHSDIGAYINFGTDSVPSYFTENRHIYQEETGKNARIASSVKVFNNNNLLWIDCANDKYYNAIFSASEILDSNKSLNVYSYSTIKGGLCSLNKFQNVTIKNIKFNGNNNIIGYKYENGNSYNIIYLGGTKNITIQDCIFCNAIMSGIHIGGAENTYSPAKHDYPENILISNCQFYNNGRNDAEIIYGKNLTIDNCYGTGYLDIEGNSTEILDNVYISNCTFNGSSPYRPSKAVEISHVNYQNCYFRTFIAQRGIAINLSNVKIHNLQPYQEVIIRGTNCHIDRITGTHGNEHLIFDNSLFLGLTTGAPGGSFGSSEWKFSNCVIDLSLIGSCPIYNNKGFYLDNSIFSSNFQTECGSVYNMYYWNNSHIHNIQLNYSAKHTESLFNNCIFTADDKFSFFRGSGSGIFKNCYIKTNILGTYGVQKYFDCILGATEQPAIGEQINGTLVDGLKSDDGEGLNWNWGKCGTTDKKIIFKNVWRDPSVSGIGIANGADGVGVGTVSDESFYLYGNNENHYTRGAIKYVDNTLTIDKY